MNVTDSPLAVSFDDLGPGVPLETIRRRTETVLGEVIGPPGPVALVDFPLHQNAGDSLIWVGTVAYLRRLGYGVGYRADRARFAAADLRRMVGDAPVLFLGGGNLGDLWPEHQMFREAVIPRLTSSKVVILSQSVYFAERSNAARANAAFARHPDLTLLVRDLASLERAQEYLPDVRVRLCYDMALGAELVRSGPPTVDVVGIDRNDHESVQGVPEGPGWTVGDWGLSGTDRLRWALTRAGYAAVARPPLGRSALCRGLVQGRYDGIAEMNVRSAVRSVSRGGAVVTNRLHAHVMCSLLGIPNVVIDNSYGKIAEVFRQYSGRILGPSVLVGSAEEAVAAAGELLAGPGASP